MKEQPVYHGEPLRERREQLGYSHEDVYRKLHIPTQFLRALEQGDFDRLPGTTYAQGFLKTYCEFLGLDPDHHVRSFREAAAAPPGLLGMDSQVEIRIRSRIADLMTWASIVGILLLGWIAYAVIVQPETSVEDRRVEAGTIEMVVPEAPLHTE